MSEIHLKNDRELNRLIGKGKHSKRMTAREILPGVVVHVADDVDPETMKALEEMMRLLIKQVDEGKIGKKRKK
jgi:imidazolonepropionase-like amidohydrolase